MKVRSFKPHKPFRKLCPYCGFYVINPKAYFEFIKTSTKTGEVLTVIKICRNCLESDLQGILGLVLPRVEV